MGGDYQIFNMFSVVEFKPSDNGDTGGLAVISQAWLTPLKREAFWPPFKDREKFNWAVKNSAKVDEESWRLFPINKIFYETGRKQFFFLIFSQYEF